MKFNKNKEEYKISLISNIHVVSKLKNAKYFAKSNESRISKI